MKATLDTPAFPGCRSTIRPTRQCKGGKRFYISSTNGFREVWENRFANCASVAATGCVLCSNATGSVEPIAEGKGSDQVDTDSHP